MCLHTTQRCGFYVGERHQSMCIIKPFQLIVEKWDRASATLSVFSVSRSSRLLFFVTAERTLSGCKDALDWSLKDGCVRFWNSNLSGLAALEGCLIHFIHFYFHSVLRWSEREFQTRGAAE